MFTDYSMVQTIIDPVTKFTETFYGQVAVAVVSGVILGLLGAIVSRIIKRRGKK